MCYIRKDTIHLDYLAEQYAIQTGQHPEKTTRENIARYREQLDKIGFSFDWSRKYVLEILIITNIPNGFSFNCF